MGHGSQERLQKVLARAGIASRRASEVLIEQGRVTVNGKVDSLLGTKVDPQQDVIAVDNKPIPSQRQASVYVMLHKPAGVLSAASDERGRRTVVDLLDLPERVYPVGRLDLKSEGLILLTNDGDLAEKLTHPRYQLEKEYHVLVRGRPSNHALHRWHSGEIEVAGKPAAKAVVERLNTEKDDVWLKVILTEGRKRQIREVAKAVGHPVIRLERVRMGSLRLGRLKAGQWRHLTQTEVERLKSSVQPRAQPIRTRR